MEIEIETETETQIDPNKRIIDPKRLKRKKRKKLKKLISAETAVYLIVDEYMFLPKS